MRPGYAMHLFLSFFINKAISFFPYVLSLISENMISFLYGDFSCQDPISSQYEEVSSRSLRSLSTDHSLDEFDAADLLYSSVSEPGSQRGASSQGQGEYGLVGPATLPRAQRDKDDAVMYELVGSRPPSKSAPPTYEMVQSSKKNTVENAEGLYDLVQDVQRQESPKPLEEGSTGQEEPAAPQIPADTDAEKQDQTSLYSTVTRDRSRKKKPSVRGLSMITEGENEGVEELSPVPTPEETAPPLPAKSVDEGYAIYEIKRFLEETAKEDEENGIRYQKTNGNEQEPDASPVRSGSAFQQLKAFLQELDSTESD